MRARARRARSEPTHAHTLLTANLLQQLPLSFVVAPFGKQPHVPFVQEPEQQSLGDEHEPFCGTQQVPATPQRGAVTGELYF